MYAKIACAYSKRKDDMIIRREPDNVYHENPAYSSTEAKLVVSKGMQALRDSRNGIVKREDTASFIRGRAFHCLILEPDAFDSRYVVKPDNVDLRTREGKEWKEASAGRESLTQTTLDGMALSMDRMPKCIKEMLAPCEKELTVRVDYDDIALQCRFDAINMATMEAYDLKTVEDIGKFRSQVANLMYDFSAGWYDMVWGIERGLPLSGWTWVVAEMASPYRWMLVELSLDRLANNRDRAVLTAERICSEYEAKEVFEPIISVYEPPRWSN
jgi:hypothetical protein